MTEDFVTLGRVMFDAVHAEPSPYSAAQRLAWLATPPSGAGWQRRLLRQHVAVAQIDGDPVGFMSLEPGGHIDLAFLCASARGRGLFRQLHQMLEAEARSLGLVQLDTFASLAAIGPFSALGYRILYHETVQRAGESLQRAAMEKQI